MKNLRFKTHGFGFFFEFRAGHWWGIDLPYWKRPNYDPYALVVKWNNAGYSALKIGNGSTPSFSLVWRSWF